MPGVVTNYHFLLLAAVEMKAREELIARAKVVATENAIAGRSQAFLLAGQPLDPTEVLQASGFSYVIYNPERGTVMADWSTGSTGLERHLLHLMRMFGKVEAARALVTFWPVFQTKVARSGPDKEIPVAIEYKQGENPPERAAFLRMADECGLSLTAYNETPGSMEWDGSGMGGTWTKHKVEMTVVLKDSQ